jgi:D-glycero-D-manno-heptose 1,7-bisphosphate phosphatase
MNRAVFLDRDGVINRAIVRDGRPYAPASLAELELLPGVDAALARLKQAGFLLIVATNQPDIGKGLLPGEVVEHMHEYLRSRLPIDDFKVCCHTDEDGCRCRKPKPGMLTETAAERSIRLSDSFMVGDRWRDIEAGRNAGCKTILIQSSYRERAAQTPDWVAGSLLEASRIICP